MLCDASFTQACMSLDFCFVSYLCLNPFSTKSWQFHCILLCPQAFLFGFCVTSHIGFLSSLCTALDPILSCSPLLCISFSLLLSTPSRPYAVASLTLLRLTLFWLVWAGPTPPPDKWWSATAGGSSHFLVSITHSYRSLTEHFMCFLPFWHAFRTLLQLSFFPLTISLC